MCRHGLRVSKGDEWIPCESLTASYTTVSLQNFAENKVLGLGRGGRGWAFPKMKRGTPTPLIEGYPAEIGSLSDGSRNGANCLVVVVVVMISIIWMIMAPVPVLRLLPLLRLRVFMRIPVVF
jgi:hypothetical protein